MARKKHNPGCPCCSSCECYDTLEPTRSFTGTPTVKVVISGVSDTVTPFTLNRDLFGSTSFLDEYTISGLSDVNGTYFFAVPKKEDGCIEDFTSSGVTATPFEIDLFPFTVDVETTEYTLSGYTCTTVGVTTQSVSIDTSIFLSKHASAIAGANPGDISVTVRSQVSIPGLGANVFQMLGRVFLQCPNDYDYSLVDYSKVNSMVLTNDGSYTWPVNSGDIKAGREIRAIFTRCGFAPESSQFQDFGTITAELLDL